MKLSIRFLPVMAFVAAMLFPFVANAVGGSGACSWHGGVNCSAGADWDGSVICMDGWTGSTVSYYSVLECSYSSYIPTCVAPSTYGCTTQDDYNALRSQYLIGGALSYGIGIDALQKCADQITAYEKAYAEYDLCMLEFTHPELYETKTPVKDGDALCREQYGNLSYEPPDNPGYCRCIEGYTWSPDGTSCVAKVVCVNGTANAQNQCECSSTTVLRGNTCLTPTEACIRDYGVNAVGSLVSGNLSCGCGNGFELDSTGRLCVKAQAIADEVEISPNEPSDVVSAGTIVGGADVELTERMKGRILLQVEDYGKAWYVNDDGRRHYMADGTAAYGMMRSFGLGITDVDLAGIPSVDDDQAMLDSTSACTKGSIGERLKGRILLQVQQRGEAWYIHPDKCRRIYMKDGDAAYSIMRFLSLGISNADIEKISAAE